MTQPLRILLLEDSPTDAELNERMLRKAGIKFDSLRVDTSSSFAAALDTFRPDIILADYNLPGFDGLQALAIAREKTPQTPYIFVSGVMGEERAVDSIKLGAIDYIIKDRLARLPMAVQRALEEKKEELQRREVEERFRKITESAQDAIIMMGPDQCISFWNAAAERIFGYTSAEALGQELHTLVTPAQAHARFAQAFPHFQAIGEGPLIGKVTEVTALRKGGEEFPVELSMSAMQLNGQWHAISFVRDITERKRVECQLRDLAAHLQTVREEEKAGIAREIHDELGGMLTAMKMETHQLKTELPQDKNALPLLQRVESISQIINVAAGFTRQIITDLRPAILDDLGILAAIEWQAAQFHKRTGIECRVNCIGDKGNLDKLRSIALFRILQEALTNVTRHSGASRVEIEFHHSEEEAVLSISDNGCGLAEDRSAKSGSYGILGMIERVEQLGGTIRFDALYGGGLGVTVILPLPA